MKKEKIENKTVDEKEIAAETVDTSKKEETEAAKDKSKTKEKAKTKEQKQIEKMQKELADLKEKLATTEHKLLLAHADFENFRKRGIREKAEIRKNTQLDTLSTVIPVLDHFDLAINAAEDSKNVTAVLDGMKLIEAEFGKALTSLGVDTINAIGETFNPELHEAVAKEASDEHEKDVVISQWRAGYKLGDRLIRPATVVVSTGADDKEEEEAEDEKFEEEKE